MLKRGGSADYTTALNRSLVRAEGLTRYYGSTCALYQVDLEVAANEALFVVGDNGSGKSTLLSILAGAIRPDSGSIRFSFSAGGTLKSPERAQIGYVPSGIGLYADLTVAENLALRAVSFGHKVDGSTDIFAVQEKLGILDYSNRRIKECSQGVARRASIAAALLGSPQLLILDEPLVFLDSNGRECVERLLQELLVLGKSVVVAAHEPEFVNRLATRVVVLSRGRKQDLCSAFEEAK